MAELLFLSNGSTLAIGFFDCGSTVDGGGLPDAVGPVDEEDGLRWRLGMKLAANGDGVGSAGPELTTGGMILLAGVDELDEEDELNKLAQDMAGGADVVTGVGAYGVGTMMGPDV